MASPRVRKIADRIQVIVAEFVGATDQGPAPRVRHRDRGPAHR
ncbi:hypothetical protein [Nocardioides convexus]